MAMLRRTCTAMLQGMPPEDWAPRHYVRDIHTIKKICCI